MNIYTAMISSSTDIAAFGCTKAKVSMTSGDLASDQEPWIDKSDHEHLSIHCNDLKFERLIWQQAFGCVVHVSRLHNE